MIYKIDDIELHPFHYESLSEVEVNMYTAWLNSPKVCTYNSHARVPFFGEKLPGNNIIWKIIRSMDLSLETAKELSIIFEQPTPKDKFEEVTYLGNIGLHSIDYLSRSAEVAIIIGNLDYHHKGIGQKVIKKVIEHGFDQLNLNRIWLGTSSQNIAMIKIAEKVGMQKEGVQRQALWKNGEYHDIENWAILKGK